jgi:predicted nucleic acid-binding protein
VILVDSSVWIDYFRGQPSAETDRLDALLGREPVAAGDLILAEVLQGFTSERDFRQALTLFRSVEIVPVGGEAIAVQAARNFRELRARGVTVRKTIDTLIATRCIHDSMPLLYSDRNFDPFVEHLGLVPALSG